MIDFENFHALKEIQSLDKQIEAHLKEIKKEEDRVHFLKNQRQLKAKEKEEKEEKLHQSKSECRLLEKRLADLTSRLEKARERIPRLTSEHEVTATEKELQQLGQEKDQTEEQILKYMDLIETLESEGKELGNFLKGSEKSLASIQEEVAQATHLEKKEIAGYEKRIQALLDTCPPPIKTRFLALNEKYRFHNPLAFVINDACNGCHMMINRKDQINIDKGLSLEYCSSCGRIFLPSSLM